MTTQTEERITPTAEPSESIVPTPPVPVAEKTPRRWWMYALAAAGLAAGGYGGWQYFSVAPVAAPATVEVRRGDVRRTISATGKVQAVTTVQVGTQVSGTVSELHADFNSTVKSGQIIARLDPSQIDAQLKQAKASLAASEANVASARNSLTSQKANVEASKANVERVDAIVLEANRAYENTLRLVKEGVTPARQAQTDESTRLQALAQKAQAAAQYAQAVAQAENAKSQLDQAEAQATQARASVEVAVVNLDRTIIRAPIDGVVISRNVDVGQTVAASLQAPTLFLIANDLTKMQVLADIDEADVGQLSPDSKVTFTVDAFPRETFTGKISQIRLSPAVVQNVVTYTAVIDVANPKLQLKPGMTATITAVVAERTGVLLVPSAAFRVAAGAQRAGATLWKAGPNGTVEPVKARAGLTDGISTEILTSSLNEGDLVVLPAQTAPAAQQKKQSTFPGTSAPRGKRF
ncbi:MAG TPA: efflux RND transporter periplasmic adaptor subunit [Bryobacteraceae bacterium]|nr:efflux RND transporter periplasmic adaptor subunit [Bryobacteraceae bacterium]